MNETMSSAMKARLTDGRWHFQHGPIDLVIALDGDREACEGAIDACWTEFLNVLPELVSELRQLRRPVNGAARLNGPVAVRMLNACAPFARTRFITAMAAVAGAVADHLIQCLKRRGVDRASINNGGDIAIHLAPGSSYRVGVVADIDWVARSGSAHVELDGTIELLASSSIRGVATSGWRGRSFSLGIADSVTVLAQNGAAADAAATLIANAVNVDFPGIRRARAIDLDPNTDLGDRLVTVGVPQLPAELIGSALDAGRQEAEHWRELGLIHSAVLFLQGQIEIIAPADAMPAVGSFFKQPERTSCSTSGAS